MDPVQRNNLVNRFNPHLMYRKQVEATKIKEEKVFSSTLNKADTKINTPKPQILGGARKHPPVLGKAKAITNLQAERLARYAPLIQESARRHNVPVELICGVILQESGGKCKAVSKAGAKGLMQLMNKTAEQCGVTNPFDAGQNIDGGAKHLRRLLDKYHGNVELTLAAYNAGEGNVAKHGNKIPPFRETQNYVPSVLGYTQTIIDILTATSLPSNVKRA